MRSLLDDLRRAIVQGSVLAVAAACGGDDAALKPDAGHLEPYPLSALGCSGAVWDSGFFGQCCVDVQCYTPHNDLGCVDTKHAQLEAGVRLPPGSGSCSCMGTTSTSQGLDGPFAANVDAASAPEGTCCYLVGSISCVGRPFIVGGRALIAAVVERSDWSARTC